MATGAGFVVAMVGFLVLLGTAQWLHDRRGVDGEITRRVSHVSSAAFAACLPAFIPMTAVAVLALTFVAVMAGSQLMGQLSAVHDVRRATWGAWCFPLAVAIIAAAGPTAAAYVYAVLTMGLGDAAAGLVGQRWGRHRLPWRLKEATLEGSGALLAVVGVLGVVMTVTVGRGTATACVVAVLAACGLAFVESVSPHGSDNLTLPLAAALTWTYLLG